MQLLVPTPVAALVPEAEINGEMGDSHIGLQARLMSQACVTSGAFLKQVLQHFPPSIRSVKKWV